MKAGGEVVNREGDGITDSMDMSLSKLNLLKLVIDRETWRAAVRGVKKSRTWLSNWTELIKGIDIVGTEESLHPWDKSHLIMVYDPFNVLLDLVC